MSVWINFFNQNCRISSADSKDTDPSLLLNGHFDSHPGSPGAADCGSCVGGYNENPHLFCGHACLIYSYSHHYFFFFFFW